MACTSILLGAPGKRLERPPLPAPRKIASFLTVPPLSNFRCPPWKAGMDIIWKYTISVLGHNPMSSIDIVDWFELIYSNFCRYHLKA